MNNKRIYETIIKSEPLNKGFSENKKYCMTTADGRRYLLRILPISQYESCKALFNLHEQLAAFDVPICKPIEFGTCSVHLPAANAPSAADFFPLHVVAVEHDWHERQLKATLHVYEFEPTNFYFDEVAGFYVSQQSETPINMVTYSNLYNELFKRNVEVRLLKNLWGLRDAVFASSMTLWSFCKMANAKPRDEK